MAASGPPKWSGVLLAGGRSQRMGRNKALLAVDGAGGQTLWEHALAQLSDCCEQVFLLGSFAGLPENLACTHIVDAEPFAGPLAALANPQWKPQTPWLLLIPVDMPALFPGLLQEGQRRVAARLAAESMFPGLCTADNQGRTGFPIWLSSQQLPNLTKLWQQGEKSLFSALAKLGLDRWHPTVDDSQQAHPLLNLNTPEDFAAWQAQQNSSPKP